MIQKKSETNRQFLRGIITFLFVLFTFGIPQVQLAETEDEDKTIQLAILLDTSNSMDGLIDQAKSQLWTIVNELAKAKCDNTAVKLEIALYEYGNDNLPSSEGFIRMVTPLTNDLDQISEDLFKLTTNGGQEYCGHVIQTALKELNWSEAKKGFQVIYIAGNEPFTQGNVDYREACTRAKQNGVVVNTIFCGNFDEGIRGKWKNGAVLTGGDYFSIEQNKKTVYVKSPYDDDIVKLNQKLNDTYIYYGRKGKEKMVQQRTQDSNASNYGRGNSVKRAVSKSSHVYKNKSWDLVDASDEEDFDISGIDDKTLPEEIRDLDDGKKQEYIEKKKQERQEIKTEIKELNKKREAYIMDQQKEESQEGMLDNSIIQSVRKQASKRKIVFEE